MEEKEKLPSDRELIKGELSSSLYVLREIADGMREGKSFEEIFDHWRDFNSHIATLDGDLRVIYADQIEVAIKFLNKML